MLRWIFYQCTYVGVLHKSKYSLMHGYGTFKILPLYFRAEICLCKPSKYDDHISGPILYKPISPWAIDGMRFRNLSWVRFRSDIQKGRKITECPYIEQESVNDSSIQITYYYPSWITLGLHRKKDVIFLLLFSFICLFQSLFFL